MDNRKAHQDTFARNWLNQTRNETYKSYWKSSYTDIDLVLLECGYEHCVPGEYWGPGCKGRYVLHYVISGKGLLIVEGVRYPISAGDVFTIMKEDTVYYTSDSEDPLEYRWIGFSGIKAQSILHQTCFSASNPVCHNMDRDGFVDSALADFNHSIQKEKVSELELIGKLYLFLDGLILRCPKTSEDKAVTIKQDYVQRCIRYIHDNYNRDCQINSIAKELGLSRAYLFKLFKKYVGFSPSEYLQELRMHHANSLIEQNIYSLDEVAQLVGYNSSAYFSKVYRSYYNVSPMSRHHKK